MKHKRLVVLSLVLIELALGAGMYSIVQATATIIPAFTVTIGAAPSATADALEEQRVAVDGPATLTVDNSYGAVRIVAGASDEMSISAHKQVWAATPADAQVALAALKLDATKEGNTVKLETTSAPPTSFSINVVRPSVDITITVPVTTAISSHTLRGGITLSGTRGDAALTTNRGAIHVSDINGKLAAQSDSGDITAEHIRGQIQITANRGTLHLTDIRTEGELIAKTYTGDVQLKDGAAGSMLVQIVRGNANLTACTTSSIQVSTGTGDLSLGQVRADSFRLQTQRGNIGVDGVSHSIWARSDTGNITLTNGDQAALDLQTGRGTISYAGTLSQGPHELHSDTGDLLLALPKETALTLDVQTSRGQINSQFAVTMTPGGAKNHWRGTMNGGGSTLKASVGNGNIALNLLNP